MMTSELTDQEIGYVTLHMQREWSQTFANEAMKLAIKSGDLHQVVEITDEMVRKMVPLTTKQRMNGETLDVRNRDAQKAGKLLHAIAKRLEMLQTLQDLKSTTGVYRVDIAQLRMYMREHWKNSFNSAGISTSIKHGNVRRSIGYAIEIVLSVEPRTAAEKMAFQKSTARQMDAVTAEMFLFDMAQQVRYRQHLQRIMSTDLPHT